MNDVKHVPHSSLAIRDLDHFDGDKERHGEGGNDYEEGAEGEEDGADTGALRARWIRLY